MHRLLAAIILVLAVAAPARADTSITVFGGGFGFSTGSHSVHQFGHHGHHHSGSIWRRSELGGGGLFFHRMHQNHHLFLSSPPPQLFIAPLKHRHAHGHSSFFFHSQRHAPEPRVIVIIPAPLNGAIVTLGGRSSVIVVDRTHGRPVPLPARKPFAIAISPPAQ